MTTRAAVEGFLAERTIAVVGATDSARKFGRSAYRELKAKGYRVIAVNRRAQTVDGDRAYPSLGALPEPVSAALLVVKPAETESVVREAAAAGVRRIWMQQGAESEAAIRLCESSGIEVVHGECILMFARPAQWFHRFHHWLWGVFGKLPK